MTKIKEKLKSIDWKSKIGFEIFGIKIGIRLDDSALTEKLRKIFPPGSREILFDETVETFSLVSKAKPNQNGFYFENNGTTELAQKFERFEESSLVAIGDKILLSLALIAPPRMYFFHAGAVSFGNQGIIITGNTFTGKTTLVKEFIKNGAEYYSDDCAVIDSAGFLYPYPIPLGVREVDNRNYLPADSFGAKTGVEPVKVEYILMTEYQKNAVWNPQMITPGQAGFQLLEHFFYRVAVRRKPAETLEFLTNLTRRAKVFASPRNEAAEIVEWFGNIRMK